MRIKSTFVRLLKEYGHLKFSGSQANFLLKKSENKMNKIVDKRGFFNITKLVLG